MLPQSVVADAPVCGENRLCATVRVHFEGAARDRLIALGFVTVNSEDHDWALRSGFVAGDIFLHRGATRDVLPFRMAAGVYEREHCRWSVALLI